MTSWFPELGSDKILASAGPEHAILIMGLSIVGGLIRTLVHGYSELMIVFSGCYAV